MQVWEVFGQRVGAEDPQLVGSILAPDLEMALLLAREAYFRRGEGQRFAVRRRGSDEMHFCAADEILGGMTDRSYRRSDGYAGVGARFGRISRELKDKGLAPWRPHAGS